MVCLEFLFSKYACSKTLAKFFFVFGLLISQVQDYYVGMRLCDVSRSVGHLYMMCLASAMLRNVKVKGRGMAHNYPRMQLANLLIIEHWRVNNYVGVCMMRDNMSTFNEELGEITFSMLARVVLGDSARSDFEHMRKMYSLVPLYREVKSSIMGDTGRKGSLNWRHEIKEQDENVLSVGMFFRGLIRGVVAGTYRSYNGNKECYKSQAQGLENLTTDHSAPVYQANIIEKFPEMFTQIRGALCGNFLGPYSDLWPEAKMGDESDLDDLDNSMQSVHLEDESDADQPFGAPWRGCRVGHFAVGTCDFPESGLGLAVYQIVSVNEVKVVEGEVDRSFMGTQLQCSVPNTSSSCVHGSWRKDNRHKPERVCDWEIVVYFQSLLPAPSFRMPEHAVNCIEEHAASVLVFENDRKED